MKQKIRHSLTWFSLSAALLLSVFCPYSIDAEEKCIESSLTVSQTFSKNSEKWDPDETFTYVLKPESENAPMPVSSDGKAIYVTLSGDSSQVIGPFQYSEIGTYEYSIEPVISSEEENYTYDHTRYILRNYVGLDKEENLRVIPVIIREDTGEKAEAVCFANSYYKALPYGPDVPPETNSTGTRAPGTTVSGTLTAACSDPAFWLVLLLLSAGFISILRKSRSKAVHCKGEML